MMLIRWYKTLLKIWKIDILVNNAGMTINEKAEDVSYENWLKVINLNLNGVFSGTSSWTPND